jgi:hypothetical protein
MVGMPAFMNRVTKKHLGAAGVIFWLMVWSMAVASTSINDWNYWEPIGLREGLWQSCLFQNCMQNNYYWGACKPLLDTCRAFSIMVIFLGLFSMFFHVMLCFIDSISGIIWALLHGFCTVIAAVVPWSVYLAFVNFPCVIVSGKRGAGWCLAVVYFVMAIIAYLLMIATVLMEIRPRFTFRKKAPAPAPMPMMDACPMLADPCCMPMMDTSACAPMDPCMAGATMTAGATLPNYYSAPQGTF